jgi:hypothetical protein
MRRFRKLFLLAQSCFSALLDACAEAYHKWLSGEQCKRILRSREHLMDYHKQELNQDPIDVVSTNAQTSPFHGRVLRKFTSMR